MFKWSTRNLAKPNIKVKKAAELIDFSKPDSVNAEHFRALRTNLLFAQRSQGMKSLLITSSILSEGKSFTSANLAVVLAQTKKKVLIIDADLRKPFLHEMFKMDNEIGLTSLLMDEVVNFEDAIQYNPQLNIHFLSSGPLPANPSELLVSDQMQLLLKNLQWRFDFIIYDTPPASITDSSILAPLVDGVLFVVRHGYTRKKEVSDSLHRFESVGANMLGYLINDVPPSTSVDRQRYYRKEGIVK